MVKQKNEETAVANIGEAMDSEAKLMALLEQDATGDAKPEEIREQMGSQEPRLEKIEVKHAGANLFVFPGGNPVPGDKGFACVILASNFSNAKYKHAFDDPEREEGERPECKSSDGVSVDEGAENPQAANCSVCPLNCSATSQQARDLAFSKERDERCQNRLSMVVLVPGHSIPYILGLSPSSFKAFASYAQRIGGQSRFLLHEVATQITLKKVGQYGHSEAVFNKLGALPQGLRDANQTAHKDYLAYLRRTATTDRVDEAEATAKADAKVEGSDSSDAPL
jgi:hypothetical protein